MHNLWLPIVLLIVALWLPACEHKPDSSDPVIFDASPDLGEADK